MQLKKDTTQDLIRIIGKDYGAILNTNEANELGVSLLRLARLARIILTRGKNEEIEKTLHRQGTLRTTPNQPEQAERED